MRTVPKAAAALLVAMSFAPVMADAKTARSKGAVLAALAPKLRPVLKRRFSRVGVPYPPKQLTLVAYKHERRLEVWAPSGKRWRRVVRFPILAASGERGPKLREGDFQVPEGVYPLTGLNPNSNYHLSIRVGYPNARDKNWAARDGRTDLGGDIYIHGKDVSRGCLAIGDQSIEELFTLVSDAGLENSRIVIAPDRGLSERPAEPQWVGELYEDLRRVLGDVEGVSN